MLRAIALDDEPLPLSAIENYCRKYGGIQLLQTFTSAKKAALFLSENEVDLLFLDIQMPAVTGIDFYKNLDSDLMVIFTTAYSEYAVEGFNLKAVDYLLKPYSYDRFVQAVDKAIELNHWRSQQGEGWIHVKSDYSKVKVAIDEIEFLEAYADYVKIHIKDKKTILTRMTMKAILEMLPQSFVRTHKSFIVPIQKISKITFNKVMIGEQEVPIGRSYLEQVRAAIK